jgi:Rha family phage regulatory protein
MENGLVNVDTVQMMNSLEIAELTGKDHKNVLADIRKQFDELQIDGLKFQLTYKDGSNRDKPMFNLDKEQTLILASGYNVQLRSKIINRWIELENSKLDSYMIGDPIQRAKAWIAEEETRIELKNQLVIANRTKGQIADRQTATAMATASAMVRKNNALENKLKELEEKKEIEIVDTEKYYTVTELGKPVNISAVTFNKLLRDHGLQYNDKIDGVNTWFVTKIGAEYASTKTSKITVLNRVTNRTFEDEKTSIIWSKRVLKLLGL